MATIPLGRYLWERIHQCGINHIFGVPGDFNLTLLDHIYDVDGLEWVGNTNELNAAYAADGYARVRSNAGCLVTTHGVGEMSAVNGVAGAMTEQVKVIHVVGQTSRAMQKNHMMIHHSIGFSPDHQVFNKASKGFRCAEAALQSEEGAAEEIDRVLRECFVHSRPVYVFLPIDLVDKPVPAKALDTPLNLEPEVDTQSVEEATSAVLEALYASKYPALFVDCLVQRHNAVSEIKQLADKLAIPIYASNMGKGIVDETHENYIGVYNGQPSGTGVQSAFEASDLVLVVGNLPSDTNSGGFTRRIPTEKAVAINAEDVSVKGGKAFSNAPIKAMLQKLLEQVSTDKVPKNSKPKLPETPPEDDANSKMITQSWIWHRLAEFFQPHDIVIGETGTASFGLPDATYPADTTWITQTYYGSIGYATPAAFGSAVALSDATTSRSHGRTVLITGDGSLMLTMQEVGNMVKHKLNPIIFIINNAGYTIERVIHGAKQSYNDIVPFDYKHMLSFFSMPEEQAKASFHRAETKAELEEVLKLDRVREPKGLQIVEVVMDMMDVPWRLSTQVATRGPEAIKEMKEAGFKVREMQKQEAYWT
ncbi:hypothetical protein LTR85_000432 [Meristemomyces frigidus]|nr:hypothetical protein LTR85_000432 [Meristemomyces frigidus]